MSDSSTTDDAHDTDASPAGGSTGPHRDGAADDRQPGTPTSPLFVGVTLWRESVGASVGLLALLTGVHGWQYVLAGGLGAQGYTPLTLAGDLAYVVAGMLLLVAAAGSASRRVSAD